MVGHTVEYARRHRLLSWAAVKRTNAHTQSFFRAPMGTCRAYPEFSVTSLRACNRLGSLAHVVDHNQWISLNIALTSLRFVDTIVVIRDEEDTSKQLAVLSVSQRAHNCRAESC